jgi:beta-fructofuranosidase
MNDPNGPIFYKGEYHLFYQYNPEENKWGNIHWGHTKSKDLVCWQRLPIALIPSKERGESHCFSGNCIIHDGVLKIIYTSIAFSKPPSIHAEQWLAKGDSELMKWKKIEDNPILTLKIHKNLEIHDWRDPFIWKENDEFFMICGGHFTQPVQPVVLLYKNLNNLKRWQFIGSLCSGDKKDRKQGKNWECPNFFRLENKYVLIVSPHREVIYCVGDYHNNKFKPSKWKILDHSRNFYATNVLLDEKNQIVLFGWIKVIGNFWSGCLSLPKIIKLYSHNILSFEFHPNLKKLRKNLIASKIFKKSPKIYTLFESQKNLSCEIKMNFNGV